MPHLPHSHKCHASLHSHTWRALCGSSHPLTHTHWLADCPHALHTPPPLGVRVLIHLLSSATHTHTHGTHRRGPCMGGCWCGHHHHAPCAPPSHTHTHTAGLVVWAMVVLGGARVPCVCLPRHHHTRLPSHHHHQRSCATTALTHTHGTWCMHHSHSHTPHAPPHTKACCVLTTPCHTHHHPLHPPIHTHTPHGTHTRHQPHCHNGACHRSPRRPLTHTQLMPHTHHTGDRPRPSTPLAVAFREPPPPRWSCPFALLSSSLLVHQPLFSLSSMHTHAPHVLITTTMPSIPCVWCVLWGWTAPSTTVVVKHATHTLVDHCVDGSHHPTLHPPSTLTPFCAFATTNHHAIPLLQPPPHTTRPLCSSTAHSSASHTHMVWMACAFVAALTSCVWCVWMACTSHHIVHTHTATTTVALPIATPPLFGVCVWMETRATWPCPTTNHSLAWRGLLAFFTSACNQALCHPPCVCVVDWWLACVGVATCVSACVLVGCVAFHHTVCRVCLHALIHLCHHTLLLLCCCCWWW